jgi:diacylglycerol kinase (ATP)
MRVISQGFSIDSVLIAQPCIVKAEIMPTPSTQEDPTAQKQRRGFSRLTHAFGYSVSGLRCAWGETAFRQEVLLVIALIPAALYFGQSGIEQALLIGALGLVLVTELLNTGLEKLTDLASPSWNTLAKQAKDCGSAAVLIAIIVCICTWLLVLASHMR